MKEINRAFTEVSDIIKHMEKSLVEKIPRNFVKMIEDNKDNDYKVNIDYSKSINEQPLLQDTRTVLSLIYRDYICSPEKRMELIIKDHEEIMKKENELREKYTIDFEKKKQDSVNDKNSEIEKKDLIEYHKNSWVNNLINKLLRFFGIKN